MSNAEDAANRFRFRPPALDRPIVEIMQEDDDAADPSINGNTALGFLQAVYRSADQPMGRRMRAAIAAMPHESPKIAVSSGGPNKDFAGHLERARNRSAALIIDNTITHIDPLPAEEDATNAPIDAA